MAKVKHTILAEAFVTTYAVGNERGFAVGEWFDLNDYCDKDDFIKDAVEYVKTELGDADPELCFSDFEYDNDLIKSLLSEGGINEKLWEVLELDNSEVIVMDAYLDAIGLCVDDFDSIGELNDKAQEAYRGEFTSLKDFGYGWMEDGGYLNNLPCIVRDNLDFEGVGKNLMQDYAESNGMYFLNI